MERIHQILRNGVRSMTQEQIDNIKVGTKIFYIRFIPTCGISEIQELYLNRCDEKSITAVDRKTKQMFLIGKKYFPTHVFINRSEALQALKKIEKENNYKVRKFTIQEEDDDEGEK